MAHLIKNESRVIRTGVAGKKRVDTRASFNFKPSQKSESGLETGAEMRQPSSNLGPRFYKFGVQLPPQLEAGRPGNKIS